MTNPRPSATVDLGAPLGTAAERAWAQVEDKLRVSLLGEYELRGLIGRGGMAAVYLADELVLDRKVAIKVMSPALVYGEGMVDRFRREAKTIAGLSHPHIIPLYRVVERDEVLAIIMKFVNGRPLDSIIAETGPMPIPMVQSILAQVAAALAYAHRKGIIHRDIKPANIMIDDDGSAVVCDFGIAKAAGIETPLTMTGATVGTPRYMSPEQWTGEGLTGAADQYSLGVVAFEMLTGQPPFVGSSVMDVMAQHFNQPTPKVETLRRDVPPSLAQVVNRMLAKAPDERFAKLDDVARQLDRPEIVHDDAVRSQLMTLAASGDRHRRMEAMLRQSLPVSPAPASRSSTTVAAGLADRGTTVTMPRAPQGRGKSLVVAFVALVMLGSGAAWVRSQRAEVSPVAADGAGRTVGAEAPAPPPEIPKSPPKSDPGPSAPITGGAGQASTSQSGVAGEVPASSPPAPNSTTKAKNATARSGPRAVEAAPREQLPPKADPAKADSKGGTPPIVPSTDSTTPTVALPPVVPLAPPVVRIGTRDPNAIVYVNGRPQPLQTGLRNITLPAAGVHRLSVRADGCTPWDSTVTAEAGQVVTINYRNPKCP